MVLFDKVRPTSRKIRTIVMSYQMLIPTKHPYFLCKCQIQPNFQDQWQIVNSFLESKSTHPLGMIFDGIWFGWIFSLLKILWHDLIGTLLSGNSWCFEYCWYTPNFGCYHHIRSTKIIWKSTRRTSIKKKFISELVLWNKFIV